MFETSRYRGGVSATLFTFAAQVAIRGPCRYSRAKANVEWLARTASSGKREVNWN